MPQSAILGEIARLLSPQQSTVIQQQVEAAVLQTQAAEALLV
jgi:hypothetical protein